MDVVIKIPEIRYNQILDKNHTIEHYLEDAVRHGTPLPKVHNKLYDLDDIVTALDKHTSMSLSGTVLNEDIIRIMENIKPVLDAEFDEEENNG